MRAITHIHRRKRVHQRLEKYPHPDKWIKLLDKFLIVIAIVGPLMVLPQILKIFILKDASGVSALSWGLFALFDIPWIIYGFVHKEKPIAIAYLLYLATNLIVVLGALIY